MKNTLALMIFLLLSGVVTPVYATWGDPTPQPPPPPPQCCKCGCCR